MISLRLSLNAFDDDALFTVCNPRNLSGVPLWCYLFRDDTDEQLYVMKKGVMIKGEYSDKDRATTNRLNAMQPLTHGDEVMFEGKKYRIRILGDYSDAGRLDLID